MNRLGLCVWGVAALLGCLTPVDTGNNSLGQGQLNGSTSADAGSAAVDAGCQLSGPGCGAMGGDAGCEFTGAADIVVPLTPEQASCLGLDKLPCAACHRPTGPSCWELRPQPPVAAPPSPPPSGIHPALGQQCGLFPPVPCGLSGPASAVVPLTVSQANCAGIQHPVCGACHQPVRKGCWELRPQGVAAQPANVSPFVSPTCGIDAGP
jgi:hypothetical protein